MMFKKLVSFLFDGPAANKHIAPIRHIVKREPIDSGEIVTLECGHQYQFIRNRIQYLRCAQCNPEIATGVYQPIKHN
jgi:hypothetical protein